MLNKHPRVAQVGNEDVNFERLDHQLKHVFAQHWPPDMEPLQTLSQVNAEWHNFYFSLQRSPSFQIFCSNLANIAKISPVNRIQFNEGIRRAVFKWIVEALYEDPSNLVRLLRAYELESRELPGSCMAVLKELDDADGRPAPLAGVLLASIRTMAESYPMIRQLPQFDDTATTPFAGVLLGSIIATSYGPSATREILYRFALTARLAGGKFTAHKKNGAKGSFLKAIDLLRAEILKGGAEMASLVERLPSEHQHPVSDYERILTAARKASRNG
jgi:hypothetical protein